MINVRDIKGVGRIAAMAAAVALAVTLANQDSFAAGDGKPRTIGLTVNDTTSFVNEGKEALQAYADARGVKLLINDPKGDVATQVNQIDQFIRQKVDGIMVIAVQPDALNQQVADARAAKIPLLNINSALNSKDTAGSLEPDDVTAGSVIANEMAKHLGGKGNVVVLQGPLGNSGEVLRTKGIKEALANQPGIKVLAMDTANWARDKAANKMANWLTAFGDKIDGVIAENDDMGLGALQAIREANKKIPIIGIDGIQDGLTAVQNGEFIGTVLQNGSIELPLGLALTLSVIDGTADHRHIAFKMPYVTKEDVALYVDHLNTNKPAFIKKVPMLVDRNLKSGDYANEKE
jgi:ribose transport system substrate-binding protein